MVAAITLIFLSLLAIPSIFLAKKPNARELLNMITPYQGYIGVVFSLWGVYGLIFNGILGINWLTTWPVYWTSVLVVNLMQVLLGFLLGYGMITNHVLSKSEETKHNGEQVLAKLAPVQGKIGIAGLFAGGWGIIASFHFYNL